MFVILIFKNIKIENCQLSFFWQKFGHINEGDKNTRS
jgi:hypothetical protein